MNSKALLKLFVRAEHIHVTLPCLMLRVINSAFQSVCRRCNESIRRLCRYTHLVCVFSSPFDFDATPTSSVCKISTQNLRQDIRIAPVGFPLTSIAPYASRGRSIQAVARMGLRKLRAASPEAARASRANLTSTSEFRGPFCVHVNMAVV